MLKAVICLNDAGSLNYFTRYQPTFSLQTIAKINFKKSGKKLTNQIKLVFV